MRASLTPWVTRTLTRCSFFFDYNSVPAISNVIKQEDIARQEEAIDRMPGTLTWAYQIHYCCCCICI